MLGMKNRAFLTWIPQRHKNWRLIKTMLNNSYPVPLGIHLRLNLLYYVYIHTIVSKKETVKS